MSAPATPPPTRRRYALLFGWPARAIALAAVMALIAWRVDWTGVDQAFALHSWGMLSAAVLANFGSVLMTGLVWKSIVDGLPGVEKRTRLIDSLSPLMVGFLFNTILAARVGEFAKVLLAKRRLAAIGIEIRTTQLLGTVVVANLLSTVAWVITVAAIGLVLPLPRYVWFVTVSIGVICGTVIALAVRHSGGVGPLPEWLHGERVILRAQRAAARFWAAVKESHLVLRDRRQTALVIAAAFGVWIFQWAGIYLTLRAFGLERIGLEGAGLLLVTVTVVQLFPVLPGNVGLFQLGVIVPLTQTYGVSGPAAFGFSIVLQFTEAIIGVAVGFAFLLYEGVGFGELRRQAEDEAGERDQTERAPAGPA